jgi:antitoxin CptB
VTPREVNIKRMRMRSMRRGIKEMDLILSAYADAHLAGLDDDSLARYDALLSENDHDIYGWITGQAAPPAHYVDLMKAITATAHGVVRAQD